VFSQFQLAIMRYSGMTRTGRGIICVTMHKGNRNQLPRNLKWVKAKAAKMENTILPKATTPAIMVLFFKRVPMFTLSQATFMLFHSWLPGRRIGGNA